MRKPIAKQQGIALFIALIFLVILTLISVTAMRSSTMELYMATNEQSHRTGIDSTQSAVDQVVASNKIAVTSNGDTTCFGFGAAPTGCTFNNALPLSAGTGGENTVTVTMDSIAACPRSLSSSARGANSLRTQGGSSSGNCAYFTINSDYDATAQRGGATHTVEGFVKLAY